MYRFRSIDNLIGKYQELENQEIYFATPEQLNDPMEGFRDIFWQGDHIVWKNFLKHYLMCLEYVTQITIFDEDKKIVDSSYIPVFDTESKLMTGKYKQIFNNTKVRFFSDECICELPNLLAGRKFPIRRNELLLYLKLIHPCAVNIILSILESYGFINRINKFELKGLKKDTFLNFFNSVDKAEDTTLKKYNKDLESVFEVDNTILMQIRLMLQYNNKDKNMYTNQVFLMNEFPEAYLSRIEDIVYPRWYVTCFMSRCDNSSVWGHYGNNHKGVCLKFKVKEQNGLKSIRLKKTVGYSFSKGKLIKEVEEYVDQPLKKVNYIDRFVEIDFFRSLGNLPVPQINSQWYEGENGEFSECKKDMNDSMGNWRKSYWKKFEDSISTKSRDWKYENEYRLIINNSFFNYGNKDNRKLKYDFNDLDGIIFGIKTSSTDKLKIIEIIEKKCRLYGRNNFNFYQARYCKENGRIEPIKLSLLQFQ
jgi:hypothetical protein